MRLIAAAAVLGLCVIGGWIAFFPKAQGFDFAAASPQEQQDWLEDLARPLARQLDSSLPKGTGTKPTMAVSAARVSAAHKRIEIDILVADEFRFVADPIAAKRQFAAQLCPGYVESELGRNGITVMHTFTDRKRRPVMIVGVSPVACRAKTSG